MNRDGILLLGGGGFIGGALARRLQAEGREVHIIARSKRPDAVQGVAYHYGSLDDAALLSSMAARCATVVHLASTSTPGSSARHPEKESGNLVPMMGLLHNLREWPSTHLLFLSSGGTVYGNPARNPVPEDAPLAPLSYYGAGKVAMESFLQAYRSASHPVTILRPSNTYGPGQDLRQGFGLIRTMLEHLKNGTAIDVWGDGRSVRDYLYIDDLLDALVLAIDRGIGPDIPATAAGGIYNIGSGTGHSINSLVALVREVCGTPLEVRYRPARATDVQQIVLDHSRARTGLGWQPRTSIEAGILRTWHWMHR